jgi:hypothetical protein
MARTSPAYTIDTHFDMPQKNGAGRPQILPSIKNLPDQQLFTPLSADEHILSSPTGMSTLASAAVTQGRLVQTVGHAHTLAPMLNHTPLVQRHNGIPLQNGHSGSNITAYSPPKLHNTQSVIDQSIAQLESRIAKLRTYEEDFVKLDLDDSRRLLQDQIVKLEGELRRLKKEKSLQLAERLVREGFGGLADGVRKEIERWDEKGDSADTNMSVESVMNGSSTGVDIG